MSETAPPATALPTAQVVLRCERCDVTWRGLLAAPCWCCGAPGDQRGDVRVVAD